MSGDFSVREHDFVVRDFRFHTGATFRELRLHCRTLGAFSGMPVLVLHGTGGSGESMLRRSFAGELFGPGQPLDAARYFLIFPDALGAGDSAKPSDGLRGDFPQYTYEDMVLAQYRLVTERLGLRRLRLVIGYSMGGMHAWEWAVRHPGFADGVVPLACHPGPMAGRNWLMRRMLIDAVRKDPAWQGGFYTKQPEAFRTMNAFFSMATNGGNLALYAQAPDRERADALYETMAERKTPMDANDFLYQWDASREYDPTPGLEAVTAHVLAVNSADDERYPQELGVMEKALARIPGAAYHCIPAGENTCGHGTVMDAALWKGELAAFLRKLPPFRAETGI